MLAAPGWSEILEYYHHTRDRYCRYSGRCSAVVALDSVFQELQDSGKGDPIAYGAGSESVESVSNRAAF